MRRGKLSDINLFLIIVIAIFTLISFFTDQLVIRNEDNLRDLNIKYNNTKTQLEHFKSSGESLSMVALRGQGIINSYLIKRHIWIKTLILTENDKKYAEFFKKRKLNYKRELKFNLIDDYRGVLLGVQSIRDYLVRFDYCSENIHFLDIEMLAPSDEQLSKYSRKSLKYFLGNSPS